MPTLLHVRASARGEASYSRRMGQALVDRIGEAIPELTRVERDLAQSPLPHPDRRFVTASLMPDEERGPEQHAALALSETLIGELESADICVIDTSMHNFTVPSALKAWIDYVIRPRRTFRITPDGKIGLLPNRPVFVVVACGGSFSGGNAAQQDFLTPYLRYALHSIGLESLSVLRLESMNRGTVAVDAATSYADDWIEREAACVGRMKPWRHAGNQLLAGP